MTGFQLQAHYEEYLAKGAGMVDVIVQVTAPADTGVGAAPQAAEVILLDCSSSMAVPRTKISAARKAAVAAIDALRDGVWFGVVRGTHTATMVYPPRGLVAAGDATRAAARTAVESMQANGSTGIGAWLRLARELMAGRPDAIRHAILLTDGENTAETPAELAAVVEACAGQFQCDCRGVGEDWRVEEMRAVAHALQGEVDLIYDTSSPEEMTANFRELTERVMSRAVAQVEMRVGTPPGATTRFLKQVEPEIVDLTPRAVPVDARTVAFGTGAWSPGESRDYHLCVEVPPPGPRERMRAARVGVTVGGDPAADPVSVQVTGTDDPPLNTRMNPRIAQVTRQGELATAIQEGLAARAAGDESRALERFGAAVRLAAAAGNGALLTELATVVHIDDSATGRVRPRRQVDRIDEMRLDTHSTRTRPREDTPS